MKRIPDILLEAGILEPNQLQYALSQKREPSERLAQVLVRLGLMQEEQLVKTLSQHLKIPILDLSQIEVPEHLVALFPPEVLFEHMVIPVALKGIAGKQNLIVAMGDPTDQALLTWMKDRVTYNIRPGIAPESLIHTVLKKMLGPYQPAVHARTTILEKPETEEHTESVSLKIDLEPDGEVTELTRQEMHAHLEEDSLLHELTEPTYSKIPMAQTLPPTKPANVAAGISAPRQSEAEIREFVLKTNKNLLMEALLQALMDRKVIALEEIVTLVELKK